MRPVLFPRTGVALRGEPKSLHGGCVRRLCERGIGIFLRHILRFILRNNRWRILLNGFFRYDIRGD